jgi:hypothetical protein
MPRQGIAPAPRRIAAGARSSRRRGRRRLQASFRRAFTCAFWRLGFRQSGFRHITRISRYTAPDTWARSPVSWHAIFPCILSDSGKPSDPEISPLISARCAGDTTVRLMAHAGCKTAGSACIGSNPMPERPTRTSWCRLSAHRSGRVRVTAPGTSGLFLAHEHVSNVVH